MMDGPSYTRDMNRLYRSCLVIFIALLFVFFILGYLVGCTTTQNISVKDRTEVVYAPKSEVVDATVDAFTSNGYMLASVRKDAGLVSTKYKVDVMRKKLQAVVDSVGENRTRIRLTLDYQYVGQYGYSSVSMASVNREFYTGWFKRIESKL